MASAIIHAIIAKQQLYFHFCPPDDNNNNSSINLWMAGNFPGMLHFQIKCIEIIVIAPNEIEENVDCVYAHKREQTTNGKKSHHRIR